jgi:hypothetical protein
MQLSSSYFLTYRAYKPILLFIFSELLQVMQSVFVGRGLNNREIIYVSSRRLVLAHGVSTADVADTYNY